jgi:hypothetical protein
MQQTLFKQLRLAPSFAEIYFGGLGMKSNRTQKLYTTLRAFMAFRDWIN